MTNCHEISAGGFLKKFAGQFENYKTVLDVGCAHGANSVYPASEK